MNDDHHTLSRLKASVQLYSILCIGLLILTVTALYAFGKLPFLSNFWIVISQAIGNLFSHHAGIVIPLLLIILGIVGSLWFLRVLSLNLFRIASITAAIVIASSALFLTIELAITLSPILGTSINGNCNGVNNCNNNSESSIPTIEPTTAAPLPSTTPFPNPPPIKWSPLLKQQTPFCDNPKGISWQVPTAGTSLTCTDAGLEMQSDGEIELNQTSGSLYNHPTFRVQVQVKFQSPDTDIFGELLIQTQSTTGAEKFTLNFASNGEWLFDSPDGAQYGNSPIVPSQAITISMAFEQTVLYGFINDHLVLSQPIDLTSSLNIVGLAIRDSTSSPTVFSNFELDQPQQ